MIVSIDSDLITSAAGDVSISFEFDVADCISLNFLPTEWPRLYNRSLSEHCGHFMIARLTVCLLLVGHTFDAKITTH